MGDFTVAQVETIANSTLDFYLERRKVEAQTLQDKPLLKAMRSAEKTFPAATPWSRRRWPGWRR